MENCGPSNAVVELMTDAAERSAAEAGVDDPPARTPDVASAGAPTHAAPLCGGEMRCDA